VGRLDSNVGWSVAKTRLDCGDNDWSLVGRYSKRMVLHRHVGYQTGKQRRPRGGWWRMARLPVWKVLRNSTRDKQQKGFPNLTQGTSLHTVAKHRHCTLHRLGVHHQITPSWWSRGPWNWRSRGLLEQHGSSWWEQPQEQKASHHETTGTDIVSKQGPFGEPGLQLR
jgi:hypothetical protein